MTGHDDGLITLDIEEADDVHRETRALADARALSHADRPPAPRDRPLLLAAPGARHRLGGALPRDCSATTASTTAQALQAYYANGAPSDWKNRHVSAYATAHPYEDWAETWAHYLHMVDSLDTARSFGLVAHHDEIQYESFTPQSLAPTAGHPRPSADDLAFLAVVNGWIELTGALNEVTRSMGEPDFYPFVLSKPAVRKLHFIHAW